MQLPGRAKWLKKTVDTSATEERDKRREKKRLASAQAMTQVDDDSEQRKFAAMQRARVEETITEEVFDKKLAEFLSSRGRKGTNTHVMVRQLESLARAAQNFGFRKEISALMFFVSTLYDSSNITIDTYLGLQQWRVAHRSIARVVRLLNGDGKIVYELCPLVEIVDGVAGKANDLMKQASENDIENNVSKNPNLIPVVGNLESFLIKLEDEYMKSLQQINPHTTEYVTRLSDEAHLLDLIGDVRRYYVRSNNVTAAAVMSLMEVEHMYYKPNSTAHAVMRNKLYGKTSDLHPACRGSSCSSEMDWKVVHPGASSGDPTLRPTNYDPSQELDDLCNFIYMYGTDRARTRALLCSVYHKSLHDNYYQARDIFLISHLQENIERADTKTQILYNRTLVTLGLAAFRMGLIRQAHECLAGICSGRVKELLAQGQPRWHDKDPEQEKAERRRQIPYHMHINQDLLDCSHLLCAMLLELPQLARPHAQSHVISRSFRKYLNMYGNQLFIGPPENTREHVLASAKALMIGDWKKACDYILDLEVWNLIPNDGGIAVKAMLKIKLREEALKLYLISYANHYDSISVDTLCEMFDLPKRQVRTVVSKMIFNKDISAAWDQGSASLALYRVDASVLQNCALQVTEKVHYLVESNERILDPLVGAYGYKDDWVRSGDGRRDGRNLRDEMGGRGGNRMRGTMGRGRGDGARRGDPQSRGRGGRGARDNSMGRGSGKSSNRTSNSGSAAPRNVWGNPQGAAKEDSQSNVYNAMSSNAGNRRVNSSRGQFGSNSSSSYNKTNNVSKEQNMARPTITSFGGDAGRRTTNNSWANSN